MRANFSMAAGTAPSPNFSRRAPSSASCRHAPGVGTIPTYARPSLVVTVAYNSVGEHAATSTAVNSRRPLVACPEASERASHAATVLDSSVAGCSLLVYSVSARFTLAARLFTPSRSSGIVVPGYQRASVKRELCTRRKASHTIAATMHSRDCTPVCSRRLLRSMSKRCKEQPA